MDRERCARRRFVRRPSYGSVTSLPVAREVTAKLTAVGGRCAPARRVRSGHPFAVQSSRLGTNGTRVRFTGLDREFSAPFVQDRFFGPVRRSHPAPHLPPGAHADRLVARALSRHHDLARRGLPHLDLAATRRESLTEPCGATRGAHAPIRQAGARTSRPGRCDVPEADRQGRQGHPPLSIHGTRPSTTPRASTIRYRCYLLLAT